MENPIEIDDLGVALFQETAIHLYTMSGWWFGCHFLFSHILGILSSQLTFIFFRGVQTTNQNVIRPERAPRCLLLECLEK